MQDGSDLDTPSAEQRCIIKFLAKEEVKPAKVLLRFNAQFGEEIPLLAIVYDS
jgi:hypothetical protein